MLDGFKTGCLPLDVESLARILGVKLSGQTVYAKYRGLIFGFIMKVDTETGEMRYVCSVSGSFHTFRNGGIHNADRLRLSAFKSVLDEFKGRFGIRSEITPLYSMEFGVNLKLPYSPKRVLDAVRAYKGFAFEPLGTLGLQCETSLYTLKIYDKSKQYKEFQHDNIIRIEIRAKCSYLRRKGVYVHLLDDLLSPDLWRQLELFLLKAVDNILMAEATPLDGLKEKEKEIFALFMGSGWQLLDRKILHKKKKRFIELAERLQASKIKEELKTAISAECAKLRDETINYADTSQIETKQKQATKSTFSRVAAEDEKGDKINIKIKAEFVATNTPQPARPPDSGSHRLECVENIGQAWIRGKPGLKPVGPNTS